MATADSRFVAARRALRRRQFPAESCPPGCDPDVWSAAYRSQALLRLLQDAGETIPIAVARQWALAAAERAIDHPSAGGHAAVIHTAADLDAIQALRGWYVRLEGGDALGPFDTQVQAARALRAARGHGKLGAVLEDRTAVEDALSAV